MSPTKRKLIKQTATIALLACCFSNLIVTRADGQLALAPCDSSRLLRCQQDIMRDLQASSLNSASIQYAVSGPPYSPTKTVGSQTSCRLVRSNLDCLLQTTPNCYEYDLPAAKNTDYILRGKRFLEENGCNEPDGSWRNSNCYRSPDLRICEERYMSSVANANPYLGGSYNFSMTCPHYYRFKSCVDQHIRMNCRVQDADMNNEYLIDKAADHTWRCSVQNVTSLGALSAYQASLYSLSNSASGSYLNPDQTNYELYQQRQLPAYIGSTGNLNLLNNPYRLQQQQHQFAWQRFQNPSNIFADNLPGIGRYPTNDILSTSDRLVLADNFDSGDCTKRAGSYVRECENRLLVEQAIARDSLDGITLERKSCCSLFHYRNCISRAVVDRCVDPQPHLALELFMGTRQREFSYACREVDTRMCSGSMGLHEHQKLISPVLIVLFATISFFILSKEAKLISNS